MSEKRFTVNYKWLQAPHMDVSTIIKAGSKGEAKRIFIQKYSNVNGGILSVNEAVDMEEFIK